jgi:DNA primase
MATTVEQIKEKLSIVDIVSGYITLEKSGANYKARCPFHNEKTPSFYLSPDRGSFYCFGCGVKGDIFTFVEQFEGLDFKGALSVLATRAGVAIVYDKKKTDEKDELFQVLESATQYFVSILENSKEAKEYIKSRGLTDKTISDFRIGYATNDWQGLYDFLRKKGFSDMLIERAGLSKKSDKTESRSKYYDRFRERIIFPITDSSGRTIAFSGRTLSDDPNTPKYLNSPETPVFHKSSALFGIQFAKHEIRKRDYTILVEGQFDLVLLHQHGFTNAVASSGTAVSEAEGDTLMKTLSRFSNNLMLCFDGDNAGIKASIRTATISLKIGMDVKVATLPGGLDPADILQKDSKIFTQAIKNATHVVYFVTEYARSVSKDDRLFMRNVKNVVLPLIRKISSATEREVLIEGVAKKTGVSKEAILVDLQSVNENIVARNEDDSKGHENNYKDSMGGAFEKIFGILFLIEEKKGDDEKTKEVKKHLQDFVPEAIFSTILEDVSSRKNELVFEAELVYDGSTLEKHLKDLVFTTEEIFLKKKQQELLVQIKTTESGGEGENALVKEYDTISKRIDELKSKRLYQD